MAYYAFLNDKSIVTEVIFGIDETELIEGLDPEAWYGYLRNQKCVRTSYNALVNGFRKNYAGIGFTYDKEWDAFIPPKIFESWKLNYTTFQWEPPTPMPEQEEGYVWRWSEHNQQWIKVEITEEI